MEIVFHFPYICFLGTGIIRMRLPYYHVCVCVYVCIMCVFVGAYLCAFVSGFRIFNQLPIFIKNGTNFVTLEAIPFSYFLISGA
jgi:hypothetical protein